MAPGPGTLRIDFTAPPTADFEVAAFVSANRANLFATAARVPAVGATSLTVAGLANGTEHFIGLGIRPTTGGAYTPIGPVLTATPGTPVYVDASAPAGGDGLSPATAYNSLFAAVLNAFATLLTTPGTSINLWVKGGTYSITSTLPVTAGVNIYGGFGAAFDLATRDVETTPTILSVSAGQKGIEMGDQADNSLTVVIDGLRITGNSVGLVGIENDSTDPCAVELRTVVLTDMTDRGMRVRNVTAFAFDVVLTNSQSSRNGADGFSGSGAFDYILYNSIFASNFQEGLDLDGLTPEAGGTATLNVRSSQFFGNGAEGLDCNMAAPLVPSLGDFSVQILGCAFERNGLAGCLVDGDFELVNGYSGDILIRECTARGNTGYGFQLDLDGPVDLNERLTAFVYRVLATSNGLDGIYVSSESRAGLAVISGSAMVGNAGAGLRIEGPVGTPGNRTVAVSHCLLAANSAGGMISRDLPAAAASSIAYLQANGFDGNTTQVGSVSSNNPAAIAFANAPEEYAHVVSRSGAALTLSAPPAFTLAADLELADDGAERVASAIAGSVVTLSEAPEDFGVPGLLAAFPAGVSDVTEDYQLDPGSIALGAGLNGADAGPFGSPAAGAPGKADAEPIELFYALETTPELDGVIGASESLVIEFSKTLNGASANGTTVRARRGANTLGITLQTSGALLTILAPGAGWGAGDFQVELDGLLASDGTELSGAIILPVQH